jgi:hypothetical protein
MPGAVDGFLPSRVIGSNPDGSEEFIGDFENGVCLQGMSLVDVKTQMPIAILVKLGVNTTTKTPVFGWEVPRVKKAYYYIFVQTMPSDAPKVIDMPGGVRQVYH